jgi:hypothetical protein
MPQMEEFFEEKHRAVASPAKQGPFLSPTCLFTESNLRQSAPSADSRLKAKRRARLVSPKSDEGGKDAPYQSSHPAFPFSVILRPSDQLAVGVEGQLQHLVVEARTDGLARAEAVVAII